MTHARGKGRLSKENKYLALPSQYRSSKFYGYFRPINETPDGKLDRSGNLSAGSAQQINSGDNKIFDGGMLPGVTVSGKGRSRTKTLKAKVKQ